MLVVSTIADLRRALARAPRPVGLVPTMGYLHEGHASLVRRARRECAFVTASIFVNPTQFGPAEDLAKYPRDLPRDLAMLEREGTDLVFTPSPEDIYPKGFDTWVDVGAMTKRLEGEVRPGHFRGVTTVVLKLFNEFRAERAYFGQKDAQQVLVVKRMAADLDTGTEVVVCPTVREPDGLAMSSRNTYLKPEERKAATVLYRSLCHAQELCSGGERNAETLRRAVRDVLATEPRARVQYVSIADQATLEELDRVDQPALVSMAVLVGATRLIDNILL
ncbi:MAG: pantoate--beta-alanine ligase [Dehalococcoidia bacterium]|nr:pantoate--beta-alanine ligase [Dehalococcoidia bacterium]